MPVGVCLSRVSPWHCWEDQSFLLPQSFCFSFILGWEEAPALFTLLIVFFCFFRSDNLCFGLFIQGHDCVPYSYPLSPTLGLTNPMFLPRYWVVLVWQGGRTHYDSTENIQTLRCSVLQWKLVSLKRTPVDRIFFTPVVYAHRCVCISALPPVSVRFHDCVIKTLWLFTHTMMIYRLLTNTHIQCVRECTCNIQVYYHIE